MTEAPERINLTKPMLDAIHSALNAALTGGGFDGGDFEGLDEEQFERAANWAVQELRRREKVNG